MLRLVKRAACLLVLGSVIFLYIVSAGKVENYRSQFDPTQTVSALMVKPEVLEIASGEFKSIVADYLLLKASVFIGGIHQTRQSDVEPMAVLFKQSLYLDPCFFQTAYYIQNLLAWREGMTENAIQMLKISKKHRPWDWEPASFIGFDYFYFLKDNINASKYFMEVSEYPNAPLFYGIFATRLAQRGGQTQTAIDFLKRIYNTTKIEGCRKEIKMRIDALNGVLILENAMEEFARKFGYCPKDLDELIKTDMIQTLPENPYKRPYVLKNGKIEF